MKKTTTRIDDSNDRQRAGPPQEYASPFEAELHDAMGSLPPDANPFSSCYVRPGAIPFRFSGEATPSRVVDRLQQSNWWGQIVGPHGSGKSTCLATLIPYLKREGKQIDLYRLADRQRQLPSRPAAPPWNASVLVIVDGYEQLSWWNRWQLRRKCRRCKAGLLVTTHVDLGLPTIYNASVEPSTARELVNDLLRRGAQPLPPTAIDDALSRNATNLREVLFELYDRYERERRGS